MKARPARTTPRGRATPPGCSRPARSSCSWCPGLALFYGGMVRRKNVLATMMQSMVALAVVGVYWVAVGYALAFGPSVVKVGLFGVEDGGLIGWSWDLFFLKGDRRRPRRCRRTNIPVYVHVMFQGMFAIITPALISGAIAERIRFWPFCLFMLLWVTFVYCPLAHMVWAFDWFDPTRRRRQAGWGGHRAARQDGGARLRRRHGGPHRGRHGRAGGVPRARASGDGYPKQRHPPEQHGADAARGRPAVVRLVRVQRRQRRQRATRWPGRRSPPRRRRPRRPGWAGCWSSGCTRASRRRWGWRRASSPGWSRSRRRPGSSTSGAAWSSAWSPASSATWPCTPRRCSGTTTRSTPSASTASAGSSAPS